MNIIMFTLQTSNPYEIIGEQHAAGLAAIDTALGLAAITNIEELNEAVYDYVQPIYYPSPNNFDENQLKSIVPNAVNDYININVNGFNGQQIYFITVLLDGIFEVPVESISDFLDDVQDNVTRSGLTSQDQAPLFMAIAVGKADYAYWNTIVGTPGNWAAYLNTNAFANYANIPYWVSSAMQGTLSGANKASTYGAIDPPRVVGVDMVCALTGSIGVAAGKVIFRYLPRLNKSESTPKNQYVDTIITKLD